MPPLFPKQQFSRCQNVHHYLFQFPSSRRFRDSGSIGPIPGLKRLRKQNMRRRHTAPSDFGPEDPICGEWRANGYEGALHLVRWLCTPPPPSSSLSFSPSQPAVQASDHKSAPVQQSNNPTPSSRSGSLVADCRHGPSSPKVSVPVCLFRPNP